MKYQKAMEYMEGCSAYGIMPGLEIMKELLKRLGNPEQNLKFIHIAGTNGKGSTLAFLSQALTDNGYRVGRYISPTIFEYPERFQIQGKPISKNHVARLVEKVSVHAEAMKEEGFHHPTPFEIETAMAFLLFEEKKCDFVVLETGMGGALDATNVVKNTLVAVITGIEKDHSMYLGETLEEIAAHKAGIIKKGSLVVCGSQNAAVEKLIKETAKKSEAKKVVFLEDDKIKNQKYSLKKTTFQYKEWEKIEISLLGMYQVKNAALAWLILQEMKNIGIVLDDEKIRKAFQNTVWSGRFEIIDKKPYFLADGAHNPAAVKELMESLEFYFTNRRIIYIIGMFRDKEYEQVIQMSCKKAAHIITVAKKGNSRALTALELAQEVSKVNPMVTVADSVEEAVELAYLLADQDSVIVAFGSLAYLGDCIYAVKHQKGMRKDTHGQ